MIIKAKYPKIGNEYTGYQGYGSLYNDQTISDIDNINQTRTLITINESEVG